MRAPSVRIIAIITTFNRREALQRALASLAGAEREGLARVIVVDNGAGSPGNAVDPAKLPPGTLYLPQPENRGHGAGHAAGLAAALADEAATDFLLLDDDAEITPGALAEMHRAATEARAALAVPLILDGSGHINWFPGLLELRPWRTIKCPGTTPEHFRRQCGTHPMPFEWAPWCAMLLRRDAVERVGLPRADFGFMGDDIEYVCRLTVRYSAVLAPLATARHLPPSHKIGLHGYYTAALNLQNITYVALRLRHGRRLLRYLPGHYWRFFRRHGFGLTVWMDAGRAAWHGGAGVGPAGLGGPFLAAWHSVRREAA